MNTQIEKSPVVELGLEKTYKAIDGEKLAITFNKFTENTSVGEVIGYIEVTYPVAGLNVTLTLEVFRGFSEEFQFNSGVFKLPFVDEPIYLLDLEFEVHCNRKFKDSIVVEDAPSTCRCGGTLIPYHDEYPNQTYCSNFCEDDE